LNDQRPKASVADEQIGPAAQHKNRDLVFPGQLYRLNQFLNRFYHQPDLGRAAQPESGMVGQRLLAANPPLKGTG
jgi:hypothetical protein